MYKGYHRALRLLWARLRRGRAANGSSRGAVTVSQTHLPYSYLSYYKVKQLKNKCNIYYIF